MSGFEFHQRWVDQCDAAEGIRERYGLEKALGYLIGEKLIDFVRDAAKDPMFAGELPQFAQRVKSIFTSDEILGYLENVENIGPLAHVATPRQLDRLRQAGVVEDNPVRAAEDILIIEYLKEVLLK